MAVAVYPESEPKLSDVAARAGVSVATVSRVLNDRGYLSQVTRDKVARAIEELGYRPNQIARSLLTRRTGTIGLILPSVALPFYGEVAEGIEREVALQGMRLLLCNSHGRAESERAYLELLMQNRVDGVISGAHNDGLPEYDSIRQPVVTIDRELAPHIPNVRADNEAGGRLATEHLLSRGARRPALLTSRSHARNLRERAYRAVLAAHGIEPRVLTASFHTPEPQRTADVFAALDEHAHTIDAVFATDDLLAATVLEWAHLRGRRVPDDLRVIGFDGTRALHLALPGLTTVQQPIAALCRTAVALLQQQLGAQGERPDVVAAVELPVTLLLGRTT
jgi:LacI family sucrose operon transcriptional repressor